MLQNLLVEIKKTRIATLLLIVTFIFYSISMEYRITPILTIFFGVMAIIFAIVGNIWLFLFAELYILLSSFEMGYNFFAMTNNLQYAMGLVAIYWLGLNLFVIYGFIMWKKNQLNQYVITKHISKVDIILSVLINIIIVILVKIYSWDPSSFINSIIVLMSCLVLANILITVYFICSRVIEGWFYGIFAMILSATVFFLTLQVYNYYVSSWFELSITFLNGLIFFLAYKNWKSRTKYTLQKQLTNTDIHTKS